ncbi:MAG: pyridoxal-phosphate dependent enzyme [Planctomycetota bacterium]
MIAGSTPDMSLVDAVALDDVRAAANRIAGKVRRTPVLSGTPLDDRLHAEAFLKCENLQHTGAFKIRGATNALCSLDDDARERGVLTYSSGNHAQAIARAGASLGIATVIVMPCNAPRVKRNATEAWIERSGDPRSRVVEYDPATEVREEVGGRIAEREGLVIVPPYDHPDVIAGQGTAALELFEEAGELDLLLVCCGGGGLLSGSAIVARALYPRCVVMGVEPALADDAARSFRSGVLHVVRNPPTIADGTRTPHLGRYTFPLVLRHVDRFLTCAEEEIAEAASWCMRALKLVVEPSGALGVAGALRLARDEPGGIAGLRVGVMISGGNVDLD